MATCLIHRYRGLAVLVRSYRSIVRRATTQCQRYRAAAVNKMQSSELTQIL